VRAFTLLVVVFGFLASGWGNGAAAEPPPKPAVAELLEDDADGLLKQLTNPTGDPGEGHAEKGVVFSGTAAVKIIPLQRFHPALPGWKYRIAQDPKPGEYRYLRFAWRADGCAGIMLQLHDEKDWNLRYTAGVDRYNWGTKFVADAPPAQWAVVTRDLFQDYGERTITGIALTAFDGRAAYFDHIYLGRSVEDLDRVDATGLRGGKAVELTAEDLDRLWGELAGEGEAKGYRAFWTLVASPQAAPFLGRKLAGAAGGADAKQIRRWIAELDDDEFAVREAATKHLAEHIGEAAALLEQALGQGPSVEVRERVKRLLGARKDEGAGRVRRAVQALEFAGTPEAVRCLEELAKGPDGARVTEAAKAALRRMAASSRP
jgi:hypothetical protein